MALGSVRMLNVVEADGIILETGHPPAVCAMVLVNVRLVQAKADTILRFTDSIDILSLSAVTI